MAARFGIRSAVGVPPVRLVRAVDRVRDRLAWINRRLAPSQAVMMDLIVATWTSQAISAAAELGVADALAAGPMTADALAHKVGADPDALDRLLRALVSRGVFRRRRNGDYALNGLAQTLRTDRPGSMAGAALFYGSPQHREHWSMLAESIRTGTASVPRLRGKGFFEYLDDEPDLAGLFNDAMTSVSGLSDRYAVAAYDFDAYRNIVDVGGGHGRLLAVILAAAPNALGVVYDLPDVIAGAAPVPELGERLRLEAGSFFESVPSGADLYVLKHIIHDWPDHAAIAILRNVRDAAGPTGTVVLIELVIPDHDREFVGKWADLEMLLCADGRERTAAQYAALCERAGLQMTRVIPTASPYSLIEAKPRPE